MKRKIKEITMYSIVAAISGCNSGGTAGSSVQPLTTIDFAASKQYATLQMDINSAHIANKAVTQPCLTVSNSKINSGNEWYLNGAFTVTNTCSAPQNLSGMQVIISDSNANLDATGFQYSTVSPWMEIKTSAVTSIGEAQLSSIIVTLTTEATLTANQSVAITYGYNSPNGNAPKNITVTSNGEVTPVAPGNINLSLNTKKLSTVCKDTVTCNIPVILTGQGGQFESVITTITNANAGKKLNYKLTNLIPGNYALTVPASSLPAQVKFDAPVPFYLSSGETLNESANFSIAKVTTGTLSFNIVQPTGYGWESLPVSLIDADSHVVVSYISKFGIGGSIDNINAGRYTLVSNGLADAQKGVFLNPLNKVTQIKANKTTDLGNLELVVLPETNVVATKLKITGLDKGDTATITLTDNYKGKQYTFNQFDAANGITNLKLLRGDNVTLNVIPGSANKYEIIAPVSGTIKANGTLAVEFKHKVVPPTGKYQVVGYIDGTATGAFAAIPDSAFAQYDVIIVGFSGCDADHIDCASNTDEALVPIFQKVSKNARAGAVMLLSLGGQNGSHSFSGMHNVASDMPKLADSLITDINYINSRITTPVKVSGIDLDIEADNSGLNITPLAKALHEKGYLVSAAPQASTNGIGTTNLSAPSSVDPAKPSNFILTASGMTNNDYGPAIAAGYVDYINLQAYSSGAGVIHISRGDGSYSDEIKTDFHQYMAQVMDKAVSTNCGTLNTTTGFYSNGYQVCIPEGTRILIGTVANKTAGGDATMWTSEEKSAAGNAKILTEYTQSVKAATKFSNYGGVMVWALGNDYYPSAWGGNTWDPVGAYTNNLVNLGF